MNAIHSKWKTSYCPAINHLPDFPTREFGAPNLKGKWGKPTMDRSPDSTLFDSLSAAQREVLQALVAGQSDHRPPLDPPTPRLRPRLTRRPPGQSRPHARRTRRPELALNTFRTDPPRRTRLPATRLKAAMEIVNLVETQRPTLREAAAEVRCDKVDASLTPS